MREERGADLGLTVKSDGASPRSLKASVRPLLGCAGVEARAGSWLQCGNVSHSWIRVLQEDCEDGTGEKLRLLQRLLLPLVSFQQ